MVNATTIYTTNFSSSFKYLIPEIYLLVIILVILLVSVVLEKIFMFSSRKILFFNIYCSIMALFIILFLLHFNLKVVNKPGDLPFELVESFRIMGFKAEELFVDQIHEAILMNNSYKINSITNFVKQLITIFSIICLYNSLEYFKDEKNLIKHEFIPLILFSILSLFIIISANDFIIFLWV